MNRNALRYSIAFVLFVCLCVAGILAGYRVGYSNGYASGKAKRDAEAPYPKVYQVGDIMRSTTDDPSQTGNQLDYNSLIGATQTAVFPGEWAALGGPCTMVEIAWLEALVVNATSGVHDRLETFFGDLSSLQLAVAASRKEQEEMQQARDEWIASMLEPVSRNLGKELRLIEAGIDIIGSWNVQRMAPDGSTAKFQYRFVDSDTVWISPADDTGDPVEEWYFVSPGLIVVSGNPNLAATAPDGTLVLIPNNDPQTYFVAVQASDEP